VRVDASGYTAVRGEPLTDADRAVYLGRLRAAGNDVDAATLGSRPAKLMLASAGTAHVAVDYTAVS
jgi:hypothetical protein